MAAILNQHVTPLFFYQPGSKTNLVDIKIASFPIRNLIWINMRTDNKNQIFTERSHRRAAASNPGRFSF